MLLILQDSFSGCVEVTGVFLPLKTGTSLLQLMPPTDPERLQTLEGNRIGPLNVEGMNPTGWGTIYDRLAGQHGRTLLSDPIKKTYHAGNKLNRFLYLPGGICSRYFGSLGWNAGRRRV